MIPQISNFREGMKIRHPFLGNVTLKRYTHLRDAFTERWVMVKANGEEAEHWLRIGANYPEW